MRSNVRYVLALLCLSCLVCAVAAQEKIDFKRQPETRLRLTIATDKAVWANNGESRIRAQIQNLSDEDFDMTISAALLLIQDLAPIESSLANTFSAPVDLTKDSRPATEQIKVGTTSSNRLIPQYLRIRKRSIVEFVLHAENLEWSLATSSLWMGGSPFGTIHSGKYLLTLRIGTDRGDVESNKIPITIQKRSPR